jgi:DNA-binding transcriptional LysR family regulator
MELQQVRYFLALCEHGSFSRAAEACDVSQPALTAAIKKLEEETGGPLFHREGKRLVVSELGRIVRPHLEQVVGERDAALRVARDFRLLRATPLRIGVIPTIGPVRLAGFFEHYRAQEPGVELAVREAPLEPLLGELERGELDLAIVNAPGGLSDTFRAEPLYRERYVVVFAPGHRFESLQTVKLGEVSGQPYVDRLSCEMREMVIKLCADREIELYATFRSEREDWVEAMVKARLGFAFMPEYSVTLDGVRTRPLADPAVERTVQIVDVRGRQRTPAAKQFVDGVRAYKWPA